MKGELQIIKGLAFKTSLLNEPAIMPYAKDLWPVVYILSDGGIQEAYVGETTDLFSRIVTHLNTDAKKKLKEAHFITSDRFNKSATLDIESNLIKYLSGDGQYKLLNANIGLANHNYYQKAWYWGLFKDIWSKLRAEGIARHSLEYIDNSDLFKYSPYKSLTREQKKSIITLLEAIEHPGTKNIILEGGAGTGKTVLAIFLFKLLHTAAEEFNFTTFGEEEERILALTKAVKSKYPYPKMALVVPMSSFRKTIKNVFKNIKGLKPSMVVPPAALADQKFDIVVVDEAHRLRRRESLGTYFGAFDNASAKLGLDKYIHTELDWARQQSEKMILFYDEKQSIKPSDVRKEDFMKLKAESGTVKQLLISQLRVNGGKDYELYLNRLLNGELKGSRKVFSSSKYELVLFHSIDEMMEQIKWRNEKLGLCRMLAGYAWPWASKNDKTKKDIHIENTSLQWNSIKEDWIHSKNAINEVGCIHTSQGYDLNYAGVIFGEEISYDETKGEIIINSKNYHDRNGKTGIKNEDELKEYIIHIYGTLMLRAIRGTYVYVCDEKLRNYFAKHMESQDRVSKALEPTEADESTMFIPLYDLKAAAGGFSEEQKVDGNAAIPLPARYKSPKDYFACTVIGESMNKVIPDGSVCLFRKYTGGSRDGKIVLVESDYVQDQDSGSRFTVKEYHSTKHITEEGWIHESITLKPLSTSDKYEDIHLTGSKLNSLKVIGIFEAVLYTADK
ncbi:MAG: DUF2075 domain-containing protein [Agriterribacter sp.]